MQEIERIDNFSVKFGMDAERLIEEHTHFLRNSPRAVISFPTDEEADEFKTLFDASLSTRDIIPFPVLDYPVSLVEPISIEEKDKFMIDFREVLKKGIPMEAMACFPVEPAIAMGRRSGKSALYAFIGSDPEIAEIIAERINAFKADYEISFIEIDSLTRMDEQIKEVVAEQLYVEESIRPALIDDKRKSKKYNEFGYVKRKHRY